MKIVTEKCFKFTKTKMLLCLHWSGLVCILFWTEWCHCWSVVMVIYVFIVSRHRREGCRKITHPPVCRSGPLNPPAVTKAPSQTGFFPLLRQLEMKDLPGEKEHLESAIPLHTDAPTADVPPHCLPISTSVGKHDFLLPSARHDGSRTPTTATVR